MRGIIPTRICVELERMTGQPIADLFDIVAGTSTGALVTLALVRPDKEGRPAYSAEDVLRLYIEDGPVLFPQVQLRRLTKVGYWGQRRQDAYQRVGAMVAPKEFGNARYRAQGLERTLKKAMGDAKLSEALADTVVPCYEWKAGRTMVFRSRTAKSGETPDLLMREVARGTTAAPTFFPPLKLTLSDGQEVVLIDGGMAANNPVTVALHEAFVQQSLSGERRDMHVVSLGTGRPPEDVPTFQELWSRGWLSLGMGMLGVVFDGTSEINDELSRELIATKPGSRYWRLNTDIRGARLAMDDPSDSQITGLLRLAKRLIQQNREQLEEICNVLTSVPARAS
jgi:predicted acylesterase/phospholipase RssA